jgi:hypothetical protein
VLLILIEQSDDSSLRPNLFDRLPRSLRNSALSDGYLELLKDIWNRMREFKSVEGLA